MCVNSRHAAVNLLSDCALHNNANMQLLTTAQVAREVGRDRSTIVRWVQAGKLTPVHTLPTTKGAHLFNAEDIEALRNEGEE